MNKTVIRKSCDLFVGMESEITLVIGHRVPRSSTEFRRAATCRVYHVSLKICSVMATAPHPEEDPCYSHDVLLEGLDVYEKSNGFIGNRSRDLSACSTVP
jgi:hypothetical protein